MIILSFSLQNNNNSYTVIVDEKPIDRSEGRGERRGGRRKKEGELRDKEERGIHVALFLADEVGWMDGQSFNMSHRRGSTLLPLE